MTMMAPADAFSDEPTPVSRHTYPTTAMVGDYLRAAAGLVPSAALLAAGPVGTVPAVILGGFATIFGVFGLRTLLRHLTWIEMSETGLRVSGAWRTEVLWGELDRMKIGYYSTRRDRKAGWMQLDLRARRGRVRLDSRIGGFDAVVRRAALIAAARGLALNEATVSNLQALGIKLPEIGM